MEDIKIIAIACDHAGYNTKEDLKKYLTVKGFELKDYGCFSDKSVDYADFAHPMAASVEKGEADIGISLCGSGNGINMTVNKHQGIRSALCWNAEIAKLAMEHNNANVCAIPARFVTVEQAKDIIDAFVTAKFVGGRHIKRINKIPL
ncbi:MAG: ribose 5-phosphate isomerase B [Bacteroidetes bacterium 4572_117]|nr:MAG: ribose 5-phosphate isomerase B [Bacteroidetes bacterium 4572_117]